MGDPTTTLVIDHDMCWPRPVECCYHTQQQSVAALNNSQNDGIFAPHIRKTLYKLPYKDAAGSIKTALFKRVGIGRAPIDQHKPRALLTASYKDEMLRKGEVNNCNLPSWKKDYWKER